MVAAWSRNVALLRSRAPHEEDGSGPIRFMLQQHGCAASHIFSITLHKESSGDVAMLPAETALDVRVEVGHRWRVHSAKTEWAQAVSVSVLQTQWIMIYNDPSDFLKLDKDIRSELPTLPKLSKSGVQSAHRATDISRYLNAVLRSAPQAAEHFLDVYNLGRYVHANNEAALRHFKDRIATWRDAADGTLLHYAAGSGKCVNLLMSCCPANLRDRYGLLPVHVAAMCGDSSLAKQLDTNDESFATDFSKIAVPAQYRIASNARCALVLVNPSSGKGHAMRVFEETVAPILDLSGVRYDLHETTGLGDATDVALTFDTARFDTIICVSGDGILHEVIQGLSHRQDNGQPGVFQRFPIVVVPAGSGNAVVCSQSGPAAGPLEVMKSFLTGCYMPADLMEVLPTGNGHNDTGSIFAIVSIAWGLLSDVDFDSEPLRCLGALRFTLMAVLRVLVKKKYLCEIRYRNSENENFQRISGHLDFFVASNIPFISPDTQIAPSAKIDDGKIHICLSQGKSRCSMLSMLACDVDKGHHINRQGVVYVTCTELFIEPISENSILDIDGERCYHRGAHCIMRPASASIIA